MAGIGAIPAASETKQETAIWVTGEQPDRLPAWVGLPSIAASFLTDGGLPLSIERVQAERRRKGQDRPPTPSL